MAMPVLTGRKTDSERFAGALRTYSCEALMQDNKALQAGTSHNLGQNFARAFEVTFQTAAGGLDHVWNTSWGVSTRLVGALIMTHGDDAGLVCPPRLAQYQVVIVPIHRTDEERAAVLEAAHAVKRELAAAGVRVHLDGRDGMKPGAKYYEWEGRGVPLRLEIGPRDVTAGAVVLARRTGGKKETLPMAGLSARIVEEMDRMQSALLEAARARREAASIRGATKAQFLAHIEGSGGFVYAGFCGARDLRGGDQGTDQGDDPRPARRGVPLARAADDVHVVRSAERRRGGVGQGVLTDTRFADAGLARRGRALHLAGVSLVDIAAEVGTPAYVYNAEAIRERYRSLDQAMAGVPHRICYAVKANSTLAVLRLLRDLGAGADIVSAGEMARALAAGFAPDRIVFSGVGKATDELRQAVRSRVGHLNVESLEELHRLAAIAETEGVDVAVGIRVNPDVTTETHPYISTGKSGIKFGVPVDQVPAAAAVIAGHPIWSCHTIRPVDRSTSSTRPAAVVK